MRKPQWIPGRGDWPGVLLAAALGAAALGLTRALPPSPYWSEILAALLLGTLVLNSPLRRLVGRALPSAEREPDRYAAGLRFTGKWVLRGAIILMGFKVQTRLFGSAELALIGGAALCVVPTTFFLAHALGAAMGLRRPMTDLIAAGTMICGSSAVNAVAPVVGARREEQGVAIASIFLFSVAALLAFPPIAALAGLDPAYAGLWSGLSVNDLSSAVAVGNQMGGAGGVMAAASKSGRILLLAPALLVLSLLRGGGPKDVRRSALEQLPRFLLGYIALAVLRAVGDRAFGDAAAWAAFLHAGKLAVDVLMATVVAAIGLHLELGKVLDSGARALATAGLLSCALAGLALALVALAARGAPGAAVAVGLGALGASFAAYRAATRREVQARQLRTRFEAGLPLSLAEGARLLDALEGAGLDDPLLRRVLGQLHPSIGELIPVRERSLPHGEGCRWITYWEGQQSGWALVAVCREPGSLTPIHAHPHRLIGKSIEGRLEELRFAELPGAELELTSRTVLDHNDIFTTDGLETLHAVRAVGPAPAIDLQLRGPELGRPGRRLDPRTPLDLERLCVGTRFPAVAAIDERPGQAGDGAAAGRVA